MNNITVLSKEIRNSKLEKKLNTNIDTKIVPSESSFTVKENENMLTLNIERNVLLHSNKIKRRRKKKCASALQASCVSNNVCSQLSSKNDADQHRST